VHNQSTACGKEAELITVHIINAHPVLISHLQFRQKRVPKKSFKNKISYCCSKWVSEETVSIFPLISNGFIFGSILLSQFHGRDELLQA